MEGGGSAEAKMKREERRKNVERCIDTISKSKNRKNNNRN